MLSRCDGDGRFAGACQGTLPGFIVIPVAGGAQASDMKDEGACRFIAGDELVIQQTIAERGVVLPAKVVVGKQFEMPTCWDGVSCKASGLRAISQELFPRGVPHDMFRIRNPYPL